MIKEAEIENIRHEITTLLKSTDRKGIDNVLRYMERSGFFYNPSSIRRHHNWRGGLAQHSLAVYLIAKKHYPTLPASSLILASLLHDICKAGKYYYDSSRHLHHRSMHIKGHGLRSVKLLSMCNLQLKREEMLAIRWHMHDYKHKEKESFDLKQARKSCLWKAVCTGDRKDARYQKDLEEYRK